MAALDTPTIAVCPPHHWLIDENDGKQHWCCQKCGLVRAHERRGAEARRLANESTWGRDEIALLERDPE